MRCDLFYLVILLLNVDVTTVNENVLVSRC